MNKRDRKILRKAIKNRTGRHLVFTEGHVTSEEKYLELIRGLKIDFDFKNYPDSVFFLRDDKIVAVYNMRTFELWLTQVMWEFIDDFAFEEEYDIKIFIQQTIKDHFKLTVRPTTSNFRKFENFKK